MNTVYETEYGTFEWDSEKEAVNIRKHKVDFRLACEVFADPCYVTLEDPFHSVGERRLNIIGRVAGVLLLFVVYTERNRTRIISARKVTKREAMLYEGQ